METVSTIEIFVILAVFLVALLYSSVGHGGASGYLAVMAFFAVSPSVMRPTALLLNLFVASIAAFSFYRNKHFNWKIFLSFAAASIPFAFIGGMISLPAAIYEKILGAALIFAAFRMAWKFSAERETVAPKFWIAFVIGAIIGLTSGLIGVGGGIFLTPVLLLANWTETKKAAGISAAFILVNSISGLIGNYAQIAQLQLNIWFWIIAAVAGGVVGSTLGSRYLNSLALRRVLAVVLTIAGFKLIFA